MCEREKREREREREGGGEGEGGEIQCMYIIITECQFLLYFLVV